MTFHERALLMAAEGDRGGAPLVSVLIPVLNEEQHLPAAIAAMREQELDGDVEFLFIDGRSDDSSKALLEAAAREDGRIRVLDNPSRGTAAGLNVGLRHARGAFVARMDAHTLYPSTYLQQGVDRLLRADGVSWVAGPQVPLGVGKWSRRVALALGSWAGRGGFGTRWGDSTAAPAESELQTSVFTGLWRRTTLDDLGGWDEGWPVNQDSEMAARVLSRGGRIVCCPGMAAAYVPRNSLRSLARQYWRYGFYRAKTAIRHRGSLPRTRMALPLLVISLAGAAIRNPARKTCRLMLGGYGVALTTAGAVRMPAAEPRMDAAYVPLVMACMHLSWGAGFLFGLLSHWRSRRMFTEWPRPLDRKESDERGA